MSDQQPRSGQRRLRSRIVPGRAHRKDCTFDTGDDLHRAEIGRNEDGRRLAVPIENGESSANCSMKRGTAGSVIGARCQEARGNISPRSAGWTARTWTGRCASRPTPNGAASRSTSTCATSTVGQVAEAVSPSTSSTRRRRRKVPPRSPRDRRTQRHERQEPVALLLRGLRPTRRSATFASRTARSTTSPQIDVIEGVTGSR